jgi:hypothetical protein
MAHTYRDLPSAGTTLSMWLESYDTAFEVIPGTTDISWEGLKRGVRNATPLSALMVVKRPGMPDPGQLKGKVFYDPNEPTHQHIMSRILESAPDASAQVDKFQIEYADGFTTPANVQFQGFFSEFSQSFTDPETGTATADMTIEVTDILAINGGSPPD